MNVLLIYLQDENDESHITTITAANYGNALKAGKIIFANTLPEFPETSEDGVAYVIDISGMSAEEINIQRDNVKTFPIYYEYIKIALLID